MRTLNEYGIVGPLLAVVAGLISIAVGVLIWYKVSSSLFYSWLGVGTGAHATLNTTVLPIMSAINSTANTSWTLFPIVAIIVISGIILAIVMGFGRTGPVQ